MVTCFFFAERPKASFGFAEDNLTRENFDDDRFEISRITTAHSARMERELREATQAQERHHPHQLQSQHFADGE